ncbi:hypothetical protein [Gimesia fumaroli]|uniref:hypothetical protein n=1 Tax=Gimesia fumaroli TaxID=2527976 RepID=UPI0011A2FED3|nr:hypothetical protein [Gimesia fumaroli]
MKNPDEQTAKQRVLNQFGDPIKIARQLWLDAMKEKIMSQRIMTGVSVAMAVCGFIVVGLVWSMMKQNESLNLKMLEQLASITDRPQPAQISSVTDEMSQISFQLVQDNKDKKPAIGFVGKLTKTGTQTDQFTVEDVSDESGKLNFGKLPWGKYELSLQSPWGEHNSNWESIGMQFEFTAIPGRKYIETIACPSAAPEKVPVQIKVNWPVELKSDDYFLLCDFREIPFPSNPDQFRLKSARVIQNDSWYYVRNQKKNTTGVYLLNEKNEISQCPLNQKGEFINLALTALNEKTSIKLSYGEYVLSYIYLIQKSDLSKLSEIKRHEFNRIMNLKTGQIITYTRALYDNTGFNATSMFFVPFKNKTRLPNPDDPMKMIVKSNEADGIVLPNQIRFTASKNDQNIWEINLPDLELLKIPEGVQEGSGGALGGRNGAG